MAEARVSMRGPLAWMANNPVAANLIVFVLLAGGLLFASDVKQEVFPEVALDQVIVTVPYPGASPEEVEQGVILAVEEAVRGVDGVDEIRATAAEGQGRVVAELFTGADRNRALSDIEAAVGRITAFPEDAEDPVVSLATNRREVISVIVSGPLQTDGLRAIGERMREELLTDPRVSEVGVTGLPPPEISIEVPQENLRRYSLTLPEIAQRVAAASVDLPAGAVETSRGELLVRIREQRDRGDEFRRLVVISQPDGTTVTLADLGQVIDGFRDTEREAYFNGERAVRLQVYRVGEQTPLEVAAAVKEYVRLQRESLPEWINVTTWDDNSEIYADRMSLLVKNGLIGLVLVLIVLGLFLKVRLAFWVTVGMAVSFLGTFMFMPGFDVSLNMISLFAFLLALGIVVDDAIVVGEATYKQRSEGLTGVDAAVAGVREVAQPVSFAVITTVIAFAPMLFIPGVSGEFFRNIPLIVIPILLLSLLESLFVLPSHLGHARERPHGGALGWLQARQQRFADWLEHAVERYYQPFIERAVELRYLTVAVALAVFLMVMALVVSGRVAFNFMPKIEGDVVTASIEFPFGTSAERTRQALRRVAELGQQTLEEVGDDVGRGLYADLGQLPDSGGPVGERGAGGSHLASVQIALAPAGQRQISASAFAERWRRAVGEIPGTERLAFGYSIGPGAGAKVAIELAHGQVEVLRQAAQRLAGRLREYQGVFDVDDGFQLGKEQLDLTLRPAARSLGVTAEDLARQVRGAFFGAEAVRQQRGRDELRVYVRRPKRERQSEYAVDNMIIRTPRGGEIPLQQAAFIERGRSFTSIERENGRRVVTVTADVDPEVTTGGAVAAEVQATVLPQLLADFPGLSYELSGEQQEQRETMGALIKGLAVAFFVMYALMAVAFRSYSQPLLVMFAIPFGFVGAVLGHLLMGFNLSLVSVLGLVALAGVVVNDSLVFVSAVNDYRARGLDEYAAVVRGGARRFRPILLTSLTTFFGLAPIIFETSIQARFLIPMAVSLGFGVLFVTLIVLVLVPAAYRILEDVRQHLPRHHRQDHLAPER